MDKNTRSNTNANYKNQKQQRRNQLQNQQSQRNSGVQEVTKSSLVATVNMTGPSLMVNSKIAAMVIESQYSQQEKLEIIRNSSSLAYMIVTQTHQKPEEKQIIEMGPGVTGQMDDDTNLDNRAGSCTLLGTSDYKLMLQAALQDLEIEHYDSTNEDFLELNANELLQVTGEQIANSRLNVRNGTQDARAFVMNFFPAVLTQDQSVVIIPAVRTFRAVRMDGMKIVYGYSPTTGCWVGYNTQMLDGTTWTPSDDFLENLKLAFTYQPRKSTRDSFFLTLMNRIPLVGGSFLAACYTSMCGVSLQYPITGAVINDKMILPDEVNLKVKNLAKRYALGLITTADEEDVHKMLPEQMNNFNLSLKMKPYLINGSAERVISPIFVNSVQGIYAVSGLDLPKDVNLTRSESFTTTQTGYQHPVIKYAATVGPSAKFVIDFDEMDRISERMKSYIAFLPEHAPMRSEFVKKLELLPTISNQQQWDAFKLRLAGMLKNADQWDLKYRKELETVKGEPQLPLKYEYPENVVTKSARAKYREQKRKELSGKEAPTQKAQIEKQKGRNLELFKKRAVRLGPGEQQYVRTKPSTKEKVEEEGIYTEDI